MISRFLPRRFLVLLIAVFALLPAHRALALEPDEIALIVNSNVPESTDLAEFYAKARHIPDNRILVLDLPVGDEIPFKQYEETVVPKVREFLESGQLLGKIKCFVTFYGVPLRIADRVNTAAENAELDDIRQTLVGLSKQMQPAVESVETEAKKLNPDFKPLKGNSLEELLKRYGAAGVDIQNQLNTITEEKQRTLVLIDFYTAAEGMLGKMADVRRRECELAFHPEQKEAELPKLKADADEYNAVQEEANKNLIVHRWDPAARARLRKVTKQYFGLAAYNRLLNDQVGYLDPAQSGSSFDSELSLVCWTAYARTKWIPNRLHYGLQGRLQFPTFMVSRLDGPTAELVKSMINTTMEIEKKGLTGRVVLDSLGAKPGAGPADHPEYGEYDQHFRDLADFLKNHTKLDVYIEETEAIIPSQSQADVALYCGWHNAGHYIGSCKFVQGAVGYHIGSYELVSLRSPVADGWVKGLELNGVVSTLGPVAEPYLLAFPRPDEYFPLLLTGNLTATEVYWKTVPVSSWMMACVGDPLYNPYKNNPQVTSLDLPFALRAALKTPEAPTTAPSK